MVNQTCVWSTYLCHSGPVWQKLAVFWGTQKISQTFGERTFAKFCDKNAEFVNFCDKNAVLVNFCNKNVTFSNTRYPKIPDYSENILGRVRVLLKIIGLGLTLPTIQPGQYPSFSFHSFTTWTHRRHLHPRG